MTQVLLAINVGVFLVGQAIALQGDDPGLMQFGELRALELTGAVSGELLLRGQWWRLLTCCFVHIGLMHLFMNMSGLWVMGPPQERLWGRWRFLTIYLIAGLAGSCAAMWRRPEHIVAGASGCLWGLMTAQLAWILLNRAHLPRDLVSDWWRRLATVLILNGVMSFLPGISAEGHFGGGAAGLVVAVFLHFHRVGRGLVRWASLVGVISVPLLSLALVIWAQDHTLRWNRVNKAHEIQKYASPPDTVEPK